MNRRALSASICVVLASAVLVTATVEAQVVTPQASGHKSPPAKPTTLQTVEVTGSHIRRVDLETDNPLITIGSTELQATGKVTLGDALQQLPAVTGGILSPAINNSQGFLGGAGGTEVGLRGLGPDRTLVLVNGQRILNKDLNSIPTMAIQSVQVLTSGASAIYGSDAIGGVINIILKSRYNGAQFQTNYGISDHGDGVRKGAGFLFGASSDKGNVIAGVSYQKFDSILQSARSFSKNALSTDGAVNGRPSFKIGGSTLAARDWISVPSSIAARFGCNATGANGILSLNSAVYDAGGSPTAPGDYHCFGSEPGDLYNFASVNYLATPQERTNAFFSAQYRLADNVTAYATVYHNKTSSAFQFAPAVFGTRNVAGLTVSKYNYYNPFGVDFSALNGALYRSRLVAAGNRSRENGTTTDQVMVGVKGSTEVFGTRWHWNVGMDYGHESLVSAIFGLPNQSSMLPGLTSASMVDPSDGTVVCVGTPGDIATIVPGCVPWDPFNLNSPSAQAALRSVSQPALMDTWSLERTYHADINGGLFDLPAGTVEFAGGVSYRQDYTNNTVGSGLTIDPATLTCNLGSQCSAHLQGGFNVKEGYGELFVPILQGLPMAYGLNVTLADRYSRYSDVGSTNNWKFGTEWRPVESLLIRGTVSKVFRAPSVSDEFSAPVSSAPFLQSDPCDGITVAGNPACVGVPTDGSFQNFDTPNRQQLKAVNEGAKTAGIALGPEHGKSFDFGVVYSPSFVAGLTASVDLWRIFLRDTITQIGAQAVIDSCFTGTLQFCPLIQRVQSGSNAGQIVHVIQPTGNLGRLDVKGTDLSIAYKAPTTPWGNVKVGLNATYLSKYDIQTAPGTASNVVVHGAGLMGWFGSQLESVCPFHAGSMCFYPRWRARLDTEWSLGSLSAGWVVRYTSPFGMAGPSSVPGDAQGHGVVGLDQYPSYVYNDVHVGYSVRPINTRIEVGVDNVFNRQPPLLGNNRSQNANTDPEDFDVIGRYYWARAVVSF